MQALRALHHRGDHLLAWLACRPFHVGAGALAAGLAGSPRPAPAVAVAVVAGLGLALARRPALAAVVCGLLVVGATAGAARLHAIDNRIQAARPGTYLSAAAVLLERPRPSRFGSSAAIEVRSGPAAGARVLARVRAGVRWPGAGEPGTELSARGSLAAPRRHPGQRLDWPAYLRRRGIGAELDVDELRDTGARRGGLTGAIDALRRRGERALEAGMPPERGAVARGMVLGQDEAIDPLLRDDFRRSGLAHVLAVSGQNVMLLCALAAPLLGALGLRPGARVAVLLGLIALYVPLAGAGPSLQRAGVMGAAGLVALGAGRAASRWYALLLAAAVTLAVDPRVAGDPGWQLSFAAVVGILLLTPGIRRSLRALPGPLAEGAAITLAATIVTAPLLAHHFGAVSLVSVVANLAALPLVPAIMWLGMAQVALGALAGAGGSPVHAAGVAGGTGAAGGSPFDSIVAGLGHVNGVLIGWLDDLARYFADLPGSRVKLSLGSPLAVVVAYAAIAAAALGIRAAARRSDPRTREAGATWRRQPVRRRAALAAAVAAAVTIAWTGATAQPGPPRNLTVSFLDIGQGDATLIQDGHGASVLFDGGPPEARVYRQLRDAGVRRLDLMVSTHQSRDHQGGLHEVLDRIPTRLMIENGYGTRDPDYRRLIEQADAHGVAHVAGRAGQVFCVGLLTIDVLGPRPRAPGQPPPDDPNPIGVAAIVSEGDFDLFLSADAESDAILQYPLRPVEAMKVSHHGSADPGLPRVLDRLRPQVAAIEVGAHNSYGHPAPSTMAVLAKRVPHVYRTDRDGTVTLTVAGRGMTARTAK
ncbi:MAG: competence protein ComEC [Thermoleophilaceae bacterium]|nr:competence protein ComEC [Thermoleophilaceae bacterium]